MHRRLQSGTELFPGQGQSQPTLPLTPGGCEPPCPIESIVAWSMVSIGFPSSSAFSPRGAPFVGEAERNSLFNRKEKSVWWLPRAICMQHVEE